MARSGGLLDDLLEISVRLPWWAGVGLALVSYLGLHAVAGINVPTPTGTGQIGDAMQRQLFRTVASVLQYIVPFALLVGAAVSYVRHSKRRRLHADATSGGRAAIGAMNWREFEALIGEAFRRRGFAVEETGGDGPDGGVDLVLAKDGERHLVQCKHWRAQRVGVTTVRELYGVMAARGAVGGFVVTSGKFSEEALGFAEGRNIELIDGERLSVMLDQKRPAQRRTRLAPGEEALRAKSAQPSQPAAVASPACPRCGAPMAQRVAKQGSNAGKAFWGCSAFPQCRGIVPIP
jgi:restriction system protein